MEQLKSLESSLPPEQPPTKQAIDSLNGELAQEFKIAANAVTKLYRVANEKNSLLKHQGYLDCLDDILKGLQSGQLSSMNDIHLWSLKRKNELLSGETTKDRYDFDFDNPTSSIKGPKFRQSMPPLSVELSESIKQKKKKYQTRKQEYSTDKDDRTYVNNTPMAMRSPDIPYKKKKVLSNYQSEKQTKQ